MQIGRVRVATAIVAAASVLLAGCGGTGIGAGGSCAAPILMSGRSAAHVGSTVVIRGLFYYRGPCDDTGTAGERSKPRATIGAVSLTLRDRAGTAFNVGVAHPDKRGAFQTTIKIPTQAVRGRARVTTATAGEQPAHLTLVA